METNLILIIIIDLTSFKLLIAYLIILASPSGYLINHIVYKLLQKGSRLQSKNAKWTIPNWN